MEKVETTMNILSPFHTLTCSCDEALQWATTELTQAGLRVMQTFDLHTARHALDNCPCPNHGTDECDCQMVVLLVYEKENDPITLILHGNDGQTWMSMDGAHDPKSNQGMVDVVKMVLKGKTPVQTSNRI